MNLKLFVLNLLLRKIFNIKIKKDKKIMPIKTIKSECTVSVVKNNDKFIILRDNPATYSACHYLGSGLWGNSRPIEFSSEERALSAFNRALATHLAEVFTLNDIRYCRKDVNNNMKRFYGVTFNKNIGTFKAGSKCNHLRWSRGSAIIKICDEDDTVIENILFGKKTND